MGTDRTGIRTRIAAQARFPRKTPPTFDAGRDNPTRSFTPPLDRETPEEEPLMSWRSLVLAAAVSTFFGASSNARLAPVVPRATIGHYNGNAAVNTPLWSLVNGDIPAAFVGAAPPLAAPFGPVIGNADNAKCVGGNTWGPILNIGTCVTGPGVAIIKLRTTCINGPTIALPGCLGEILISGNLVGTITANHLGVFCNVPNQPVPLTAVGASWSAQATVRGTSGGLELSSAIYGLIDVCF
jgi:hypothetical protein